MSATMHLTFQAIWLIIRGSLGFFSSCLAAFLTTMIDCYTVFKHFAISVIHSF